MFTRLSFARTALRTLATLFLAAGGALCAAPQADAQEFLVGAELFAADATGKTTSGIYQYDTNANNGAVTPLNITANATTVGKSISFALGSDHITVSGYSVSDKPTGTFTVRVSGSSPAATPEPGSVALLVGMGVTGAGSYLWRKRRK